MTTNSTENVLPSSPIKYRTFVEQTDQVAMTGVDIKSDSIGRDSLQKEIRTSSIEIKDYTILPQPRSFFNWIGNLFLFIITFGGCGFKNENHDSSIDAQLLEAMENKTNVLIEGYVNAVLDEDYLDAIIDGTIATKEADPRALAMAWLHDDLTTGKAPDSEGNELELTFERDDEGVVPGNEITKKSTEDVLNHVKNKFKDEKRQLAEILAKTLILDVLKKEFASASKLIEIVELVNTKAINEEISREDRDQILAAISSDDKAFRTLSLATLRNKPSLIALIDEIKEIQEIDRLSSEERELLHIVSNHLEITPQNLKSPNLKKVLEWMENFLVKHQESIVAKIEAEIDLRIDAKAKKVFGIAGVDGAAELEKEIVHVEVKAKIEGKIKDHFSKLVQHETESAKKAYPHLAEVKAFEKVFGSSPRGGAMNELKLLQMVSEMTVPLQEIISADPNAEALRKEFTPAVLKKLIHDVYQNELRAARELKIEEGVKYLNEAEEKAGKKIEAAILYHIGEEARVNLAEATQARLVEIAHLVIDKEVDAWLVACPDLKDCENTLRMQHHFAPNFVAGALENAAPGMSITEQIRQLGENQKVTLIREKTEQLFEEKVESLLLKKFDEQMKKLAPAYPNELERAYLANEALYENRFDMARKFHNQISADVKAFIKDDLGLDYTTKMDKLIEKEIQSLMDERLDDRLEDASDKFQVEVDTQHKQISDYRDQKVALWLKERIAQLPKPAPEKKAKEAYYDALKALVLDIEGCELADDQKVHLGKRGNELNQAFLKDHPKLVLEAKARLNTNEAFIEIAQELIQKELDVCVASLDETANKEVEIFTRTLDKNTEINKKFEQLIPSKIPNVKMAKKVLKGKIQDGLPTLENLADDFKEILIHHIDSHKNLTQIAKERLKEHYTPELLKIFVKREIYAILIKKFNSELQRLDGEIAVLRKQLRQMDNGPGLNIGRRSAVELNNSIEKLKQEKQPFKEWLPRVKAAKIGQDLTALVHVFSRNCELSDEEDIAGALNAHLKTFIGRVNKDWVSEEVLQEWIQSAAKKISEEKKK